MISAGHFAQCMVPGLCHTHSSIPASLTGIYQCLSYSKCPKHSLNSLTCRCKYCLRGPLFARRPGKILGLSLLEKLTSHFLKKVRDLWWKCLLRGWELKCMFLNPPQSFAVKIPVLKMSAKNLGGRKEDSVVVCWFVGLLVSQMRQGVSSYTDGSRGWWQGTQRGTEEGYGRPKGEAWFIHKLPGSPCCPFSKVCLSAQRGLLGKG